MPPDSSLTRASALLSSRANSSSDGTIARHCAALRAEVAAEHQQVFADREIGIEIVELRHDADTRSRHARAAGNRLAAQADRAGVRRGDAEQHAQRGGLARAVRAEQAETFAGVDMKRQSVDDRLVAVAFFDLMKFNGGFRHGSIEAPGKDANGRKAAYSRSSAAERGRPVDGCVQDVRVLALPHSRLSRPTRYARLRAACAHRIPAGAWPASSAHLAFSIPCNLNCGAP